MDTTKEGIFHQDGGSNHASGIKIYFCCYVAIDVMNWRRIVSFESHAHFLIDVSVVHRYSSFLLAVFIIVFLRVTRMAKVH